MTTDLEDALLRIERGLWTNDAALYRDSLLPEARLLFPETGLIDRDTAVEAIRGENAEGRHWAEVDFSDVRLLPLTTGAALLTYRVAARWAHEAAATHALATSAYVRRERDWKLAFHQQTPVEAP